MSTMTNMTISSVPSCAHWKSSIDWYGWKPIPPAPGALRMSAARPRRLVRRASRQRSKSSSGAPLWGEPSHRWGEPHGHGPPLAACIRAASRRVGYCVATIWFRAWPSRPDAAPRRRARVACRARGSVCPADAGTPATPPRGRDHRKAAARAVRAAALPRRPPRARDPDPAPAFRHLTRTRSEQRGRPFPAVRRGGVTTRARLRFRLSDRRRRQGLWPWSEGGRRRGDPRADDGQARNAPVAVGSARAPFLAEYDCRPRWRVRNQRPVAPAHTTPIRPDEHAVRMAT
jgi:hypothetical protein